MKFIFTFLDDRLTGKDRVYELYDLAADPDELNNLYAESDPVSQAMLAEMQAAIDRADQPYI